MKVSRGNGSKTKTRCGTFPGMPAEPIDLLRSVLLGPNREWIEDAACRRIDKPVRERLRMFFLDNNFPSKHGKAVCASCTVRTQCGEYARATDTQYGIWDGEVLKRYDHSGDEDVDVSPVITHMLERTLPIRAATLDGRSLDVTRIVIRPTPAQVVIAAMADQLRQRVFGGTA